MIRRLFVPGILIVAIALMAGLSVTLGRDFERPNLRFLPEMVNSVPYDAFDESPVFDDGMTLRPPVPGTISRGYMPLGFGPGDEEAQRAGRELENPLAASAPVSTSAVLERGARVYLAFCQVCHGEGGAGDGPVTTRGFPPPPSLLADNARAMADGRLFHIVTFGQGNMPAYAAQIAPDDRWKVVLFVRSLQSPSTGQGAQ